jgi:all-trans-retinol 13,14-reductase
MKQKETQEFDFAIAGSGFGGMCCAYILADEGFRVVLIEKNIQLGGNLQIFSRDKCILDTGVHYIGGMDEGENLHAFFSYFGLTDKLKFQKLNEDGFDIIRFADGSSYSFGQGYDNFKKKLIEKFPQEKNAIQLYCEHIQEVCTRFPLYNLSEKIPDDYFDATFRSENMAAYLASITSDVRLQNVLAGNNLLYAGVKEKTPFYVHALIVNGYIKGAYRIETGGAQLIKQFTKRLREKGVEIFHHKKIIGAHYHPSGTIKDLVLKTGETVSAKTFISNINPSVTIDIFGQEKFLPIYRNRIKKLENSSSFFTMHIIFKPDQFEYRNYNIYQFFSDDVWDGINYTEENWPLSLFINTPIPLRQNRYAESMSIMTYMRIEDVQKWSTTHNTITSPGNRGSDYEQFKRTKEEKLICKLELVFPGIRTMIKQVYSSTPLTYRDYIGTTDGSAYGILKDCTNPTKTFINTKTKIPNLYLTGQNVAFHGILGVTVGALLTCFEFVDRGKLIQKIKNSQTSL